MFFERPRRKGKRAIGKVQRDGEVYFDDFKVEHIKSPVIQSQDFYPFGLSFNSFNRENTVPNFNRYNGKEIQDELDLGLYDYIARQYDPLLGRFTSIDPVADLMRRHSPYNYGFDNPLRFVDHDGMAPSDTTKNTTNTAQVVVPVRPPVLVPPGMPGSSGKDPISQILESLIPRMYMHQIESSEESDGADKNKDDANSEPSTGPAPSTKSETKTEDEDVVYRGGGPSPSNFTPRPGIDDQPGPKSGLSTFRTPEAATQGKGGVAQKLDLNRLRQQGFVITESKDGHVSIRPPSQAELKDWAASRSGVINKGSGPIHVRTRQVLMSWQGTVVVPKFGK